MKCSESFICHYTEFEFLTSTFIFPSQTIKFFGPVVARVWPIIVADVSYPVTVCLVCCGCLGPIVVGDRDNPSKDVVSVGGGRLIEIEIILHKKIIFHYILCTLIDMITAYALVEEVSYLVS